MCNTCESHASFQCPLCRPHWAPALATPDMLAWPGLMGVGSLRIFDRNFPSQKDPMTTTAPIFAPTLTRSELKLGIQEGAAGLASTARRLAQLAAEANPTGSDHMAEATGLDNQVWYTNKFTLELMSRQNLPSPVRNAAQAAAELAGSVRHWSQVIISDADKLGTAPTKWQQSLLAKSTGVAAAQTSELVASLGKLARMLPNVR